MKALLVALALFMLAGCEAPGFAPIGELVKPKPATPAKTVSKPVANAVPPTAPSGVARTGEVVVQKGDTLFAIAFENGLDYRDLAFWNNLPSPDVIQVGQILRLTPPAVLSDKSKDIETLPLRDAGQPLVKNIKEAPLLTEPRAQRLPYTEANWAMLTGKTQDAPTAAEAPQSSAAPPSTTVAPDQEADEEWRWPAEGSLIGRFGEGGGKGINIAGEKQSPVFSSAPGKVVYSGSGLRGYGKMVIVKHPGEYLTAYAHNHAILVKEGQWVKSGQKIAEMGDTESDRVKLHFEIRQYGKPVDPLKILPERK